MLKLSAEHRSGRESDAYWAKDGVGSGKVHGNHKKTCEHTFFLTDLALDVVHKVTRRQQTVQQICTGTSKKNISRRGPPSILHIKHVGRLVDVSTKVCTPLCKKHEIQSAFLRDAEPDSSTMSEVYHSPADNFHSGGEHHTVEVQQGMVREDRKDGHPQAST